MITNKLFLACSLTITDAETNSISYVELLETMTAGKLPSPFPDFHLCSIFEKDAQGEAAAQVRIILQRPDGEEEAIVPPKDLAFSSFRYRFNFKISGMVIHKPGLHWLRLDIRDSPQHPWRHAGDWPLYIAAAQEAAAAQDAAPQE